MSRMHVGLTLPALCVVWLLAGVAPVQGQEKCPPVAFAPGQTTVELTGTAPPEDVVCFELTGLKGQSVSIVVAQGANVIFSIDGEVDAQDRYSFTATRDAYRILVGQLMRSIEAEPFRISVTLE